MSHNQQPANPEKPGVVRSAFRMTKAVMSEALNEAKVIKHEREQRKQTPQEGSYVASKDASTGRDTSAHSSQGVAVARPAKSGSQPSAKAMPVSHATPANMEEGGSGYNSSHQYHTPPGYTQQGQEQYPAVKKAAKKHQKSFKGEPTLIGTTLGFKWGVNAAIQEALAQQFSDSNNQDYFTRRWRHAVDTPLVCCFLIIEVVLEKLLVGLLNMLIVTFGNLFGTLVLLPSTIYHMYRSIVCISPRVTCQAKVLASLFLPLLALVGVFTVAGISLAHGLCIGFMPSPRPLSLGVSSVKIFLTKGHEWRKQAYRHFESPDGKIYKFQILSVLLLPIYVIIGALFGFITFLVIAILESPRLWYHLSCNTVKPGTCCYSCCICVASFSSFCYVLGVIFLAPFSGFFSGFATGWSTAIHDPARIFSALWGNSERYLNGLNYSSGKRDSMGVSRGVV